MTLITRTQPLVDAPFKPNVVNMRKVAVQIKVLHSAQLGPKYLWQPPKDLQGGISYRAHSTETILHWGDSFRPGEDHPSCVSLSFPDFSAFISSPTTDAVVFLATHVLTSASFRGIQRGRKEGRCVWVMVWVCAMNASGMIAGTGWFS